MEQKDQTQPKPKKNNFFNWFLWWQIDQEEVEKQVSEYNTLKITQSARGKSTLFLLFSVVVNCIFIYLKILDVYAFIDAFLFLFLAFFIYKGHKWAMIGAMALWTFEKVFILVGNISNGSTIFSSVLWWALYMHAFYLAFNVEKLRSKNVKSLAEEKES